MQAISYRGHCLAVVVHGDLTVFDVELETRPSSDALLRFVAAMCRFAMEIDQALLPGEYEDARAERYARELLMPAGEFTALAWRPESYLAACFAVPSEQIAARRRELGLGKTPGGRQPRAA